MPNNSVFVKGVQSLLKIQSPEAKDEQWLCHLNLFNKCFNLHSPPAAILQNAGDNMTMTAANRT